MKPNVYRAIDCKPAAAPRHRVRRHLSRRAAINLITAATRASYEALTAARDIGICSARSASEPGVNAIGLSTPANRRPFIIATTAGALSAKPPRKASRVRLTRDRSIDLSTLLAFACRGDGLAIRRNRIASKHRRKRNHQRKIIRRAAMALALVLNRPCGWSSEVRVATTGACRPLCNHNQRPARHSLKWGVAYQ